MVDLHKQFKHRWMNPKTKSVNSKIEGLGTVATEKIEKGEIVGILGGVIVPISEVDKLWDKIGHVGIQIDENFYICPTSREELKETGVFNHSCNPNAGFKNSIVLIAMKNIKKGDEIVFDYAYCETNFEPFKCSCKSANCRKIIKPTDWQIKELQEKYYDYFSPFLKSKIVK